MTQKVYFQSRTRELRHETTVRITKTVFPHGTKRKRVVTSADIEAILRGMSDGALEDNLVELQALVQKLERLLV